MACIAELGEIARGKEKKQSNAKMLRMARGDRITSTSVVLDGTTSVLIVVTHAIVFLHSDP